MAFSDTDLTQDQFLGGKLVVSQPRNGYRAGVDPVLLAAAVPAVAGQSLLDLGCGAGVASLCLGRRVPGLRLTGVEMQSDYADLARRNADANGIPMTVVTADLRNLPADLKAQSFDHVIANPPYFQRARGSPSSETGRETALGEGTALSIWVDAALRLSERELKMMHRLVRAQARRIEHGQPAQLQSDLASVAEPLAMAG